MLATEEGPSIVPNHVFELKAIWIVVVHYECAVDPLVAAGYFVDISGVRDNPIPHAPTFRLDSEPPRAVAERRLQPDSTAGQLYGEQMTALNRSLRQYAWQWLLVQEREHKNFGGCWLN